MRLKSIQYAVFLCLGAIGCALVYTQVLRGGYYYDQSVNNRIRVVPLDGPRGRILDRNGVVLADNRVVFHLGVVPQDVEDERQLFAYLGAMFKKDPGFFEQQFQRKQMTPFAPVILAEDIPRAMVVSLAEEKFRYPGLVIEQGFQRYYPFGENGAHVLGYVGKIDTQEMEDLQQYGYTPLSTVGKTGIEKKYDAILKGQAGGRQIEINSRGQEVRLLGIKEPGKGKDIVLTIDQRAQSLAQQLLNGRRGSIVVMDLTNGDLMAMASSPSFDPNIFTDKNQRERVGGYFNDPASPLMNRSISGQYPPGSVFKIAVALAAVQLNKITPSTTFDCPGYLMLGRARFGCAHVHGVQDLYGAISRSCNVYFFHVGKIVTAPVIGAYARALGLARATGVDLPFEAEGKMACKGTVCRATGGHWYSGDTLNLSIGQGQTLVTPLQLAVLIAAVANDGVILQPRLVKMLGDEQRPDPDFSKRPMIRLRDETWRVIQKGLRGTVEDEEGTAHALNDIRGVVIYGKTGTAQSSAGKANHAWFVGYAKSSVHNLAFCVFLDHGGASANAVMIAKELLLQLQSLRII